TEFQAGTIVAYLRSLASGGESDVALGDPARGREIFEGKGQCMNCHRVRGEGSRLGPNLSDIGTLRRPASLEQSLLDPSAEILPQNRIVRAVTKDGKTITGHLMNEDTFTVEVLDTHERLRLLQRSDLSEFTFVDQSPMPSYKGKLSKQELSDLLGYLASLKGVEIK
ncbi:MAG TPA: c-type cytochrome, partial [Bryobacteraceae bacterium]|nr:c-type cytochrome [Bryobacteraceae bacterium]